MKKNRLAILLHIALAAMTGVSVAWGQDELLVLESLSSASATSTRASHQAAPLNSLPATSRSAATVEVPQHQWSSVSQKPVAVSQSVSAASTSGTEQSQTPPSGVTLAPPSAKLLFSADALKPQKPPVKRTVTAPKPAKATLTANGSQPQTQPSDKPEPKTRMDQFAYEPNIPQPQQPRNSGSARTIQRLGDLNSGVTAGGTTRSYFRDMVLIALNHSPEVRGAIANLEQSTWSAEEVKGQRYPQLKVGMNTPFRSFGEGNSSYNSSPGDTSASVSVSTTLFDWGKISADLHNARENISASELAIKEEREQIASSTATELLNLSRYQASLVIASQYAARMQELVNMLSQIAEADRGRASELTQARARLYSAEASKDQLRHQYDATKIKLVRLLGVEPVVPSGLRWNDGLVPAPVALAALNNHPTLLRGEAQARAADAKADSIKAAGMPQIDWVVSKSTAKNSIGEQEAWYTGLNVEWSLFSGGSERAAHQAALAQARSMREKEQTTKLELEYQVRNMIETRDSSLKRAEDYDRLSAETDKVRHMFYDQWYHLGTRTLLDVLTAETDHFNNQISAINNRYDGYVSNVSIMYNASILLNWLADKSLSNASLAQYHSD